MESVSNKKKVLVTGANGMLGSAICHQLVASSYDVRAFCYPGSAVQTIKNLPIDIAYGNVLDEDSLGKAMEGCQFVIHVAALTDMWPKRSKRVVEVNLKGTENVARAVEAQGLERMVYIGSASSFKYGSQQKPANETSKFDGWDQGLDYIDSKYMAQLMLIEKFSQTGFPCIIINPTFMIGPYDTLPSSGKMLLGLYQDKVPGYTNGGKNFVSSLDVAMAAVNSLSKGRLGECYIAGGQNMSYKEFFTAACKVMGKEFKLIGIPDWAVKSIGWLASLSAGFTGKPPKLTYELAKISTKFHGFDPGKAIRELDMPQTPIDEAIATSFSWFAENGYLKT